MGGEINPVALKMSSKKKIVFVFIRSRTNQGLRIGLGTHEIVARMIESCKTSIEARAMSGAPANFPNHVSVTANSKAPVLKKRRGCGCFGSVTGAILFALAVLVILNPWALHIGGRWTPALT